MIVLGKYIPEEMWYVNKTKDPEYIRKKIKRLEKKLRKQTPPPPSPPPPPPAPPARPPPPSPSPTPPPPPEEPSSPPPPLVVTTESIEEELPEEYLLALGHEGEEKSVLGESIRNELSLRWSKIMAEGLTREQREALLAKYPTPLNFQGAVAPLLNKEIAATLSELSINRDKRITVRQNMMGKLMSALGRSLTDIMKGNINSKKLIEEMNDAAKMAADIYYSDSKSRKFFALSTVAKSVQDVCKDTKPGKYLFGDNLSDQLKAIQAVTRTVAQIKGTGNKATTVTATKSLNVRGPSQYQTNQFQAINQRGRGRLRTTRRPAAPPAPRRPAPPRKQQKPSQRRTNRY